MRYSFVAVPFRTKADTWPTGRKRHLYYSPSDDIAMCKNFGYMPFYVSAEDEIERALELCDGLFIPGNEKNIHPSYWGELSDEPFPNPDDFLLDKTLILAFHKVHKPILGICGGLQSIAVTFGGSLKRVEGHNDNTTGKECRHPIADRFSSAGIRKPDFRKPVNSYHNWAVDRVPEGFQVDATHFDHSDEIEAIITTAETTKNRGFVYGMQWHPEIMLDDKDRCLQLSVFFTRCEKIHYGKGTWL